MWPNQFAQWMIQIAVASDATTAGVITLIALMLYAVVTLAIPAGVFAWIMDWNERRVARSTMPYGVTRSRRRR
mgnify:CR=1 FL=1